MCGKIGRDLEILNDAMGGEHCELASLGRQEISMQVGPAVDTLMTFQWIDQGGKRRNTPISDAFLWLDEGYGM